VIRDFLNDIADKGVEFLQRHESLEFMAFCCMGIALLPFLTIGYVCSRFSGK